MEFVIREDYLKKIRPFIDKDVVKVLVGMRRSGKSTLLLQVRDGLAERGVAPGNMIAMNFESEALAPFRTHDALYREIVRRIEGAVGRVYLFFDEIQRVASWELCVNSLRVDIDCDIYLTGSNAHLLSGELATHLAGRYLSIMVQPFSYREALLAMPNRTPREVFSSYRVLGGMPFLAQTDFVREESMAYLRDIYNSIVLKDIVQRYSFRDIDQLERVIAYFFSEIGTTFSAKNIVNVLADEKRPASRESIYRYIEACESALLISRVRRQDVMGKELLRAQEKLYVTDVGIREALLGTNESRVDCVLENIVYNEMVRRGWRVTIGKVGTREIDFVGDRAGERMYVQVAYLMESEATRQREFGAYESVPDNYPKYVVSMDEVDFSQNGILHLNVRDFLLAESW